MLIFVFYLRRQISCTIPHLVEMQDSLYQAKFLINDYENWYKWRVPVSKHQNNNISVKYLVKGVNRGPFMTIFQSSSKQFQSNISRPNNIRNFYTFDHLHF